LRLRLRRESLKAPSACFPHGPLRSKWIIVNERSCIYRLISKWAWAEKLCFFHSKGKTTKIWYFPGLARAWIGTRGHANAILHIGARNSSSGACPLSSAMRYCIFRRLFQCSFFHETCIGTWNKISPLCNVIRGLLNFHSLSSQILLRCFTLPIYIILSWITSKTSKNCLVLKKLKLHNSK